jgi:hypothetical protein
MCWYYKGNRDDDRLYVELDADDKFVPYDELPVDMVESDGKINVALNSFCDFESSCLFTVSPGITTMRKLLTKGYVLVKGEDL